MAKRHHEHTLCWDCANATNNRCSWVDRGEPVEGWRARKTTIRFSGEETKSYCVHYCPLFERDAERGGLKKLPLGGEVENEGSSCNQHSAADAVCRMAIVSDSGHLGSGDSPLADYPDRKARLLKDNPQDREVLDLAFGIIEQAVRDWKVLEYGSKESAMVEKGEWIHRKELVEFFFSKWFARLCEPLHYSPEEIRAALHIPEDSLWKIRLS